LLLNVTVAVGGYQAADQVWVPGDSFEQFVGMLSDLERVRQGRADLEAATSDDFALTIASTDSAGHMAVQGHLSDRTPDGYRLSLHFGFTFDPGLLMDALRAFRALRGGIHAQLR
jgi:hypothetical protein